MTTNSSRIYTKLGDDGSTGLLFGGRTSKADPLMEAIGAIDETVATLGLARAACGAADRAVADFATIADVVLGVQRDLFVAGADLAANPRARGQLVAGISLVTAEMISALERVIDERMAAKPLRPVFVVPGENQASAALDMARTQVRRAERRWVAWRRAGHRNRDDQHGEQHSEQRDPQRSDQHPDQLSEPPSDARSDPPSDARSDPSSDPTLGTINPQVGIYLNRVSDLLYVLARQAAGDSEEPASHGPA